MVTVLKCAATAPTTSRLRGRQSPPRIGPVTTRVQCQIAMRNGAHAEAVGFWERPQTLAVPVGIGKGLLPELHGDVQLRDPTRVVQLGAQQALDSFETVIQGIGVDSEYIRRGLATLQVIEIRLQGQQQLRLLR